MNDNIKYILSSLGIFLSVLACEKDQNNKRLIGHWHITPINSNTAFESYSTIDILDDSLAIFDRGVLDQDEGFSGVIDYRNRQMLFGGECLVLNFKFDVIDDSTLVLNQQMYDGVGEWTFMANKCSNACCSKEQDYFKHSKVLISLPIAKDSIGTYPYTQFPLSLLRYVYIGRLPSQLSEVYGNVDNVLLLGDKISTPLDIRNWKSTQLLKVPETVRDRTRTVLMCDTSTSYKSIQPILFELKELGESTPLLAVNTSKDSFSIRWMPITLSPDLDSLIIEYFKN